LIKLRKGEKPQVLRDNAATWTEELIGLLEAADDGPSDYQKGRYNNAEIKDALVAETSGKCAYCESKVLHIDFGDIEHILPKKERPELWFDWDNLTLACGVCNNKKRAYYSEVLPLLDPYEDEPEGRLLFFGPFVRAAPGDESACITERQLDLNRAKLLERRIERMDNLLKQATVMQGASAELRPVLQEDFLKETGDDRDYASLARGVARQLGVPLP
jgi:uncharacterized protein (TIGR02646 family)